MALREPLREKRLAGTRIDRVHEFDVVAFGRRLTLSIGSLVEGGLEQPLHQVGLAFRKRGHEDSFIVLASGETRPVAVDKAIKTLRGLADALER